MDDSQKTENYTNQTPVNSPLANLLIVNGYLQQSTTRAFMQSPCENVFYEFHDGKIVQVWSVIDKVAIEAQLPPPHDPGGA
jgi:hypothetical protein